METETETEMETETETEQKTEMETCDTDWELKWITHFDLFHAM